MRRKTTRSNGIKCKLTVSAVALLMSVSMWPQSVTDASASAEYLRDKADSLYNAQQYDEAKAISLKALDRLDKRKDKSPTADDDETRGDLLNLVVY